MRLVLGIIFPAVKNFPPEFLTGKKITVDGSKMMCLIDTSERSAVKSLKFKGYGDLSPLCQHAF
jgi:hypothetical protein